MSQQDKYSFYGKSFPAITFFDISADNNNDVSRVPRSIFVGTAGDLTVRDNEGNEVTFPDIAAGTILPIQPVRVMSTGTTAGSLIGLI